MSIRINKGNFKINAYAKGNLTFIPPTPTATTTATPTVTPTNTVTQTQTPTVSVSSVTPTPTPTFCTGTAIFIPALFSGTTPLNTCDFVIENGAPNAIVKVCPGRLGVCDIGQTWYTNTSFTEFYPSGYYTQKASGGAICFENSLITIGPNGLLESVEKCPSYAYDVSILSYSSATLACESLGTTQVLYAAESEVNRLSFVYTNPTLTTGFVGDGDYYRIRRQGTLDTGYGAIDSNGIVFPKGYCFEISQTPTPSVTATITPSITFTNEPTQTPTPSITASQTQSPTTTPTITNTATPTLTPTNTNTPTNTETQTQTPTPSITASQTPTQGSTPTPTITQTQTPTPSITASQTPTTTTTLTATQTQTQTQTPTPSITASQTPTTTTTLTATQTQTQTPTTTTTLTAKLLKPCKRLPNLTM